MKKRFAFILALATVCTAIFAGCANEEVQLQPEQPQTQTQTPVTPNQSTGEHLLEVKVTDRDQLPVLNINGKDFSAAFYRSILIPVALSSESDDENVWMEETIKILKETQASEVLAGRVGIYLSDEDYETALLFRDNTISQIVNQGAEASYYYNLVDYYAMTDTVFIDNLLFRILDERYIEHLIETNSYTDQQVIDYVNENYVRVKHILIKTQGLDDAQKAEARSRADRILDEARNGASFEDLVINNSEDGMDPETGYYFTYGTMVQEFEDASYALEEGEISDIVESQFGYHIIKKYPMEESYILNDAEILDSALFGVLSTVVNDEKKNEAEFAAVTYYDDFEQVNADIIAEIRTAQESVLTEESEETTEAAAAA